MRPFSAIKEGSSNRIEYFKGHVVYFSMIKDLRLHGNLGPVEFFAFVGGASVESIYFYKETASNVRFFSKGIERQ